MSDIVSRYESKKLLYEDVVNEVIYVLKCTIPSDSVRIVNILGRCKDKKSLLEKLDRKSYQNIDDVPDLAGVRVVCLYESDLNTVNQLIKSKFKIIEFEDKLDKLGIDKMGYQGFHFVVQFHDNFQGVRYDNIKGMNCEIQVRTILQDAWSNISKDLVYKHESSVPNNIKRELNNVMSLLEVGQDIFDRSRSRLDSYINQIDSSFDTDCDENDNEYLDLPIDYYTLIKYTRWKYPNLSQSKYWNNAILEDIDRGKYKTIRDIDEVVNAAKDAVDKYRKSNPELFKTGTDYLTKSLGFMDMSFRERHGFGVASLQAFKVNDQLLSK